ncbi:MAG: hypothetical protein ACOX9C_02640 [Kiritimatiellia bacterium]|jgi:hypothetical protein
MSRNQQDERWDLKQGKERREPRQWSDFPVLEHRTEEALTLLALAATPVVVAAAVAGSAAVAGVQAVRKWRNYRPPRWKLLQCPKAEEVLEQWKRIQKQRDPVEALRFGAMLLNVSQYVDCSPIHGRNRRIVARNPGLKGWLRDHCREINYVTAMSYRKLAQTACQAIGLPEFLPLEWVMPGTESQDETRELNPENKAGMKLKRKDFLRQIQTCREKLVKLLEGARNVNQLNAALDGVTNGHRHRASVKITEANPKITVERGLRQLRVALDTLQTLPPDQPIASKDDLLALINDLKRHVESRPA